MNIWRFVLVILPFYGAYNGSQDPKAFWYGGFIAGLILAVILLGAELGFRWVWGKLTRRVS